jgi:hypothetical protein
VEVVKVKVEVEVVVEVGVEVVVVEVEVEVVEVEVTKELLLVNDIDIMCLSHAPGSGSSGKFLLFFSRVFPK